ncbi:methyltransferase [Pseudomonas sp. B392_1p]|uniref:methyltransferase n=1 Tax=Pseudomonas sp. B392_1p TaxID=3457507 RepID=UPI003FD34EA2
MFRFRKRPTPQTPPLFAIGSLQLSEKVYWLAAKGLIDPLPYVQRHQRCDWGDVSEAERQANVVALDQDAPMRSRFRITHNLTLDVITSDDHRTTIVQLPEEEYLI